MGKRKKTEIKLSEQELVPSTIGYLEENKKGFVGLILIFVVFIGVAIFMPEITDYVNKYLGKVDSDVVDSNNNSNNNNNNNNNGEEVVIYDLSDTLEIEYNDLKFSKFKINGGYLSFSVENTTNELVDFSSDKYFIETYSSDTTLLERHIFNGNKINPSSTLSQNIKLQSNEDGKVAKIEISNKTENDYPDVKLIINNNNEFELTCSNDVDSIVYTYDKNNKLLRIKDTVNYKNDKSTAYASNLLLYQNKVATYNNKEGVSSSLVEVLTGFTVTTDINLKNADITELNNEYYYGKNNLPKVVKFEMESRGFSCQ